VLYQDLPVFADVYALTVKVFTVTQEFPREYKFTLGQDMKRDCLVLLRSIYRINKSRDKAEHLEGFLDDFELLRLQVRLATGNPSIQGIAHVGFSSHSIARCGDPTLDYCLRAATQNCAWVHLA